MAMLVQHLKQKIKMVFLLSNMYEWKIASGKLLYNTGSLAWCSMMTRKWKSLSRLCDPMDYTAHGICQARLLEWIARGSSQPRDQTQVSHIAGRFFFFFYQLSHKESPRILEWVAYPFYRASSLPRNPTRVSCIAGRFFINWAIREAPWWPRGVGLLV